MQNQPIIRSETLVLAKTVVIKFKANLKDELVHAGASGYNMRISSFGVDGGPAPLVE